MNPEPPQTPREEIEIRITALLLGDLPLEQAAALEAQIAADPQLAALHIRLRRAMEILRESRVPNPPLQLSADRRARLLAAFRGIATLPAPAPLKSKPPRDWKTFIPLGLAALLMAVIGASLAMPASSSMSGNARRRDEHWNERVQYADTDGLASAAPESRFDTPAQNNGHAIDSLFDKGHNQPESLASASPSVSPGADLAKGSLGWESQAGAIRNFKLFTLASDKPQISGIYLPPSASTDGLIFNSSIMARENSEFDRAASQQSESRIGGAAGTASGGQVALAGKDSENHFSYSGSTTVNGGALGAATASPAKSQWGFSGGTTKGNASAATAADDALPLDLFKTATVEPYAISEPLSVAGRVTVSRKLAPFTEAPAPAAPALESRAQTGDGEKKERAGYAATRALQVWDVDRQMEQPIRLLGENSDAVIAKVDDPTVLAPDGGINVTRGNRAAGGGGGAQRTTADGSSIIGKVKAEKGVKLEINTASEATFWDAPVSGLSAKAKPSAKEQMLTESESAVSDVYASRGVDERSGTTKTGQQESTDGTRHFFIGGGTTGIVGAATSADFQLEAFSESEAVGNKSDKKPASPGLPAITGTAEKKLADPNAAVPAAASLFAALPLGIPGLAEPEPALVKAPLPPPVPQPEVRTKENAFSTFSLNVSDVSFKLACASLEKGGMPERASVRSEEFINAFDYRDPEPAAGAPLAFACERARSPFAQNRDLLRLSVKTAAAGRQPGRPLNLVLLLDNSGSMERADRVRIVHEALRVLAAQLQPQDKLSIITFARTPRLWADGVAGDKAGEVTARVGEITPQGGTDIAAALDLGYATALRHYQNGSVNRVVLLTDGAANLGNVDPAALKQKVETHRKQGVAFDCFGVGWEGYNDDLLEQLSRNGDGRYGFINTPEAAATEFAGQLAGALRVAASDVKVQVEFNPHRVLSYRQIGYAKHQLKKEQFRDNTVDAAEIGAAESGNALYAVEVDPRGEGDLATVRVRFKVPGTGDYREHEWVVPFTAPAQTLEQSSSSLRLAACAAAFSEWLTASPHAGEVTPDRLLAMLNGIPAIYGADARPAKLEWMIRQARSISGR